MADRYPEDWSRRRRNVYRRDNYTCQNCGVKGGPQGDAELHAHHGVPVSKGGSHDIDNLTTYCSQCHKAIHGKSMAPTASSDSSNSSEIGSLHGLALVAVLAFLGYMYQIGGVLGYFAAVLFIGILAAAVSVAYMKIHDVGNPTH